MYVYMCILHYVYLLQNGVYHEVSFCHQITLGGGAVRSTLPETGSK